MMILLMEQEPLRSIERMNELDLLQFISPEIKITKGLKKLLEEIRGVTSWFNLLYLEEPCETWKVYWHGLTSPLDDKALKNLAIRMQMEDLDSRKMISQRMDVNKVLDNLFRLKGNNNFGIYTLLSQYDTEILLFLMAKADNKKIKRLISNYFTKLKYTKVILKGKDLKEMGFQPGPIFKTIFESLMDARLNYQINSKGDEIAFVKEKFGDLI